MPATVLTLPNAVFAEKDDETQLQPPIQEPSLPPVRHTYFDDRPSWDQFGLSLFCQTSLAGTEQVIAAQGLVLPNKINLRQKTHATLFPIELGGIHIERNVLENWLGPNYAIPLRALSSRTMAQQPTFNHSGWERRRTPKQGLMARFEVARQNDGNIKQLHIFAWVVDINTGKPTEDETGTQWQIPNRF